VLNVKLVALPAADAVVDDCAFCGQHLPLPWVVALRAREDDLSDDLIGALAVCEAHAQGAVCLLARAFSLLASAVAEQIDLGEGTNAPRTA
jgi:hypothetical protein